VDRAAVRVDAHARAALAAAACLAACSNESVSPPVLPAIGAATVAANPTMVVAAVVSVTAEHADSVAVRFQVADATADGDSITPAVSLVHGTAAVPVLGLHPSSRYVMYAVAFGEDTTAVGDSLELTTGPLPADVPSYTAAGSDPSPGYVVFAAGPYGLVIDNAGRVVWYHRFPNGPGLNFEAEPTGRYYARPTTPDPTDQDLWVEVDPLGNVSRTFGCADGLQPRFHDLIAELDGAYWIMCDEVQVMDLSPLGGVANAQVTGTVVEHVSAAGALLFRWSPFDHFAITDLDSASRTGNSVNWTHGNSLDLDTDGNLVVSFRSLSEIDKIDTKTGAVLWRMGGRRNQFAFEDAPTPAFSFQHGLRLTGPGRLLLLDNMGDPSGSWAERYVYDETGRTARMASSYGSLPPVTASLGGSTQDLPGGHTLVSFGPAGRVEEYDATGQVVWHIAGNPGYVFRAQRIVSLYQPGVGSPR
jgi:Arylsulfotransferase (ASST)